MNYPHSDDVKKKTCTYETETDLWSKQASKSSTLPQAEASNAIYQRSNFFFHRDTDVSFPGTQSATLGTWTHYAYKRFNATALRRWHEWHSKSRGKSLVQPLLCTCDITDLGRKFQHKS